MTNESEHQRTIRWANTQPVMTLVDFPPDTPDWAVVATRAVLHEVNSRKGFEIYLLDVDVLDELALSILEIIRLAHEEQT